MIKRSILLLFVVLGFVYSAYGQNLIEDGNRCFDNSDYTCAITKYKQAFNSLSGKDKNIAEIKLMQANSCSSSLKIANEAFRNKNYTLAKREYQNVLDINPKDSYAKTQIEYCNTYLNTPKLRKATTADLRDIWAGKYGVLEERRQKLIQAGIDPDDAQRRVNAGEGKPVNTGNSSTLTVSRQELNYNMNGGNSIVDVTHNGNYSIVYLPSWCKVNKKNDTWFSISCEPNKTLRPRSDWFKVVSGNKEIKITVNQLATTSKVEKKTFSLSTHSIKYGYLGGLNFIDVEGVESAEYKIKGLPSWCSVNTKEKKWFSIRCENNKTKKDRSATFKVQSGDKEYTVYIKQEGSKLQSKKGCFNCPKSDEKWGLSVGYLSTYYLDLHGAQFGLKYEPLFKNGFGLNFGINYERYFVYNPDYSFSYEEHFIDGLRNHAINIPMHLQYRLNFSRAFNIFAYGGIGFNFVGDSYFENFSRYINYEYGAGVRFNSLQLNVGFENPINNDSFIYYDHKTDKYFTVSMSIMF